MKKVKIAGFTLILCFILVFLVIVSNSLVVFAETEKEINTENEQINENAIKKSIENTNATAVSVFEDKVISSCEYIYNLDDTADYVYMEFAEGGYAIYAKQTMELLEYSMQGSLPYQDSNSKKYYAGPANYLQKSDNGFLNVSTGEKIKISQFKAENFSNQVRDVLIVQKAKKLKLKTFNENDYENIIVKNASVKNTDKKFDEENLIIPTSKEGLIPNAEYFFANPTHGRNYTGGTYGNNNSGTCGSVAAQILLGYNNYYNDRRIIADRFLNGYSDANNSVTAKEQNPNYCSDPMSLTNWTTGTRSENTGENSFYSEIVTTIMEPNSSGASVKQVKNGINTYLSNKASSVNYDLNYKVKNWCFGYRPVDSEPIESELNAGRPLIITTSSNLGGGDHFVVGYGQQDYSYPDSEDTYSGYVVHYGWKGDNNVWINSSWCDGYISLKINHIHNYNKVGKIGNTNRTEYKCSECGHRTDAAIKMLANSRYEEAISSMSKVAGIREFNIKFETEGNKLIQTFGEESVIFIYDTDHNCITFRLFGGFYSNTLINFNAEANKVYIVRVLSNAKSIKLGITPADKTYSSYKNIAALKGDGVINEFSTSLNTTHVMRYTPSESGTYTFRTNYVSAKLDSFLYLIDPTTSTEACIYNDDGAGDSQALITANLIADRTYFLIACTYNITASCGNLTLTINKIS